MKVDLSMLKDVDVDAGELLEALHVAESLPDGEETACGPFNVWKKGDVATLQLDPAGWSKGRLARLEQDKDNAARQEARLVCEWSGLPVPEWASLKRRAKHDIPSGLRCAEYQREYYSKVTKPKRAAARKAKKEAEGGRP